MHIGSLDLRVGAGSVVLIMGSNGSTSILNLHDEHTSVMLGQGDEKLILPPGQQVIVTNEAVSEQKMKRIAYRNLRRTSMNGNTVYTAEYSLPSAFSNVALLKSLLSGGSSDRNLAGKILKTAAAMNHIRPQQPFHAP